MKNCDFCHAQAAIIHLTDIKNGKKTETHLCQQCAADKGLNLAAAQTLPSLLEALSLKKAAARAAARDEGPACPRCGITWGEFRAKGRFGCGHDYVVFRERLQDILHDMHGREPVHVGRAPPVRDGDAAASTVPNTTVNETAERPRPATAEEGLRENLKRRLDQAIAEERYEEAARLRDELSGPANP